MPLAPAHLARELLKLVAVVVVSAVAGIVLGIALNHLFGTVKPSGGGARRTAAAVTTGATGTTTPAAGATTSSAAATTSTAGAAAGAPASATGATSAAPAVPVRTTLDLGGGVSLRVTSATFVGASTAVGKAARRARLVVQASMTNSGTATVTAPVGRLVVRAGTVVVRPDPAAGDLAGALLQPLAPGKTASGELHFETRGAATGALMAQKRVPVRYGPQALIVSVG